MDAQMESVATKSSRLYWWGDLNRVQKADSFSLTII